MESNEKASDAPVVEPGIVYIHQFQSSRGGNMVFRAGKGWSESPEKVPAVDGDFVFEFADGTEAMRLSHTGEVFVRGERVDADRSVDRPAQVAYDAFRDWLATVIVRREKA